MLFILLCLGEKLVVYIQTTRATQTIKNLLVANTRKGSFRKVPGA